MAVRNCSISIICARTSWTLCMHACTPTRNVCTHETERVYVSIQMSAHAHANISLQFYRNPSSLGIYTSRYLWCVCVCVCVSVGTISCGKVNVCGTPAAEARNISSWKIACFACFLDYLFAKANKSETDLGSRLIKSLKTSKQHPSS